MIDKENGGKADALNAGINAARHSLFCAVDADSILQRDSLLRVVQPFLEDERTVAAGGIHGGVAGVAPRANCARSRAKLARRLRPASPRGRF